MHIRQPRIYLNGFMGSGKSTVGPLLARALGWGFVDLDDKIEASIGGPITAFFQNKGEAAFREIEMWELQRTAHLKNHVVAVGGGALCNDENIQWARSIGTVIFLDANINIITQRLINEQTTRPMLLDEEGHLLESDVIENRIINLWMSRLRFYSQSDIKVETDLMNPLEVTRAILNVI